jgi:hypothetical protein
MRIPERYWSLIAWAEQGDADSGAAVLDVVLVAIVMLAMLFFARR